MLPLLEGTLLLRLALIDPQLCPLQLEGRLFAARGQRLNFLEQPLRLLGEVLDCPGLVFEVELGVGCEPFGGEQARLVDGSFLGLPHLDVLGSDDEKLRALSDVL